METQTSSKYESSCVPQSIPYSVIVGMGGLFANASSSSSSYGEECIVSTIASDVCVQSVLLAGKNFSINDLLPYSGIYGGWLVRQYGRENTVEVISEAVSSHWLALSLSLLGPENLKVIMRAANDRNGFDSFGLKPLISASLSGFLEFWRFIKDESVEPEISVSPLGLMQAEWLKDDDHSLVLEFQESGDFFYSLWEDGQVCEGICGSSRDNIVELVNMFKARNENPFQWVFGD